MENQRIFSGQELIKKECQVILRDEYDNIKNYFKNVIDQKYDCIVFISRRCYVLFLMFAIIEGWTCKAACTDLGIFYKRDQLKKYKKVIVIDDIGFTGTSMKGVLKKVKRYVPFYCKISAGIFALNISKKNQILDMKIGWFRKIKVKCYCQLTDRQCQSLSTKLVSAILASGIPYTTFVYPIWGTIVNAKPNFQTMEFPDKNTFLKEHKWITSYVLDINNDWGKKLSSFQCVRIYKKDTYICYLPFLFMRGIKVDKIDLFYNSVARIFENLGKETIAKEIVQALSETNKLKNDAVEYLSNMMSCFLSRALAVSLDIPKYVDVQLGLDRLFLMGSFSNEFCNFINDFDKEFINQFFKKFLELIGDIDTYLPDEISPIYIYYDKLSSFVKDNKSRYIKEFDMMCAIFEWMKNEALKNVSESSRIQTILINDLVSILKTEEYDEKKIYLAQIECWDRGVATYRFSYDNQIGIVANCGVGEMSSNISALKYQALVRKFFNEEIMCGELLNEEKGKKVLTQICDEAITNQEYTTEDIEQFKKILNQQQYSLYSLLR